ncbi:unnamed protein product, partial [Amoebophrya sp. A25]
TEAKKTHPLSAKDLSTIACSMVALSTSSHADRHGGDGADTIQTWHALADAYGETLAG